MAEYLDFLQYKYRVREPRKVVALGGLWKDLDFDVTDEEVRALRQRVSQHSEVEESDNPRSWARSWAVRTALPR